MIKFHKWTKSFPAFFMSVEEFAKLTIRSLPFGKSEHFGGWSFFSIYSWCGLNFLSLIDDLGYVGINE